MNDPDEVPVLLKRLAQFQEAHGNWEKSYQLYKQLGDFDALVNLIEHAGIPMYQNAIANLEFLAQRYSTVSISGTSCSVVFTWSCRNTKGSWV